MDLISIIPTCDDKMSIYTLIAFAAYTIILIGVVRCGSSRMDRQEADTEETTKAINDMKLNIAVMAEGIRAIRKDGADTRTVLAEINHTLLDKLT
jgi:hypothetical protein